MEDKKVKAGSVAVGICLFVIAILLVLIVVFFYNITMEKNNLQHKINELEITIEEKEKKVNELENKISKVSDVVNDEDVKYEEIILQGDYVIENSDVGYVFYPDKTVECTGNVQTMEGTYYAIGDNKIELKFSKVTIYEEDVFNPVVKEINQIYKATIKDENTLCIEGEENGEKYEYEIIKYINTEEIDSQMNNKLKASKTNNIKYEITTRKNEYDEEMLATIKATKDGKAITKELDMNSLIADTGTMVFPMIGNVALIATTGGEAYLVDVYQLIDDEIKKIGTINCGADMVEEATYEATKKDKSTVVITATRNGEKITNKFKMDTEISSIEIIEVPKCGKVVLVAETDGEYYKFKAFRLSQNYINGKTTGIFEFGLIQ